MAQPNPFERYLLVQRKFDLKVLKVLEETAKSLQNRIARLGLSTRFSDSVRANQLKITLAEIRRQQAEMFLSIGDTIRAGQIESAIVALDDLASVIKVAAASLPSGAADALISGLRSTGAAGIESLYARIPRALSKRLYKDGALTSGAIEKIIQQGLVSGLSARELARDVYRYVSPTAPGGASYVAMRLARTEINNAFHNQQIAGSDAPGVEAVQWHLSRSHRVPDRCNDYAEKDLNDLGVGLFPPGQVPSKPHPQCFCFLTLVSVDPDVFARDLRAGKYDAELKKRFQLNLDALREG